MSGWIQCPSCRLKHTARPDGVCPRCRAQLAPSAFPAALSTTQVPPYPPPVAPYSPPVAAPSGPAVPPPDYFLQPPAAAPRPPPPPAGYGAPGPFHAGSSSPPRFIPPLAPPAPLLTAGEIFSGTFSLWKGSAGPVVALVCLVALPAALLMAMGVAGHRPTDLPGPAFWLGYGFDVLVGPLQSFAVVRAAMRRQRGQQVEFGDLLSGAGAFYFPILGASILATLAAGLVAVTIIGIPVAIWLLTAWTVCTPAIIEERLGPAEGMQRSWELTRGRRGSIFGGMLLLGIVLLLSFGVVQAILEAVLVGGGGEAGRPMAQFISTLGNQAVGTIFVAAEALVYHRLRGGDLGLDRLQNVFE